jgi:pimeloyl-ACP methyl ester carboxylesterase
VTRRSALWWLFLASGLLFLVLAALDNRLWDEGGPGIVGFELAWDNEHAQRILAEWGEDGRDAAWWSLWIDLPYLALYSVFWALAVRAARDHAARRRWEGLAALGSRLWPLALVAGMFDLLEDVSLMIVLGGAEGRGGPFLAAVFATLKFLSLAVVVGYVALVLVRRFPRVTAVGAAAVVALLLINTWVVERATEPAKPDIGRIVELPGGDIQVREDGSRNGPPVVLIHGFGASMRWFDDVVPLLPRDLRIVRIDLLGHGGSEKPRDGYSMENQADIVAQAMERLGIRRAAVVGHSMGGAVGTALVERHPEQVTQLMMIGTSPDDENLEGGLVENAAFWPVIGHANDRLVSKRLVRWVLEQGFAPKFDPPKRLAEDPFQRTTWSALNGSFDALSRYWDDTPLHERLSDEGVPVTVVLGQKERHTKRSVGLYNSIPRARTVVMQGLDHSPQIEAPERTAPLIAAVALGR